MSGVKFNNTLIRLFNRYGEDGQLVNLDDATFDDFGNPITGSHLVDSIRYLRVDDRVKLRLFGDGYTIFKDPRILVRSPGANGLGVIPLVGNHVLTNFGEFEITNMHTRFYLPYEVQYFDLELRDV